MSRREEAGPTPLLADDMKPSHPVTSHMDATLEGTLEAARGDAHLRSFQADRGFAPQPIDFPAR